MLPLQRRQLILENRVRGLRIVLPIAALMALVALRFVGLGDYPALNPDEGFWTSGARNSVLFGDAFMDGRLHPFLSPGMFVALSSWFQLMTPSLETARAFSAFAGLAACALLLIVGRRAYPTHPWLVSILFGFSAYSLVLHRVALLEAHQTFWLVLAGTLWLSRKGYATSLGAGLALGCALLVKSNAVFLVPAFILTLPERDDARRGDKRLGLAFLAALIVVAGAGYLAAWAYDPARFVSAFKYELDGNHFADEGVLFRVARFGLHPGRLMTVAMQVVTLEPVLFTIASLGLFFVIRDWKGASRADRFFAWWAMLGAAFHFGQIYIEARYFTTLVPAAAYLAANPIQRWMAARGGWRVLGIATVSLLMALGTARAVRGIILRPNAEYWQLVAWVDDNVQAGSPTLVSPSIGLSLPLQAYDFFRLMRPYDGARVTLASVVERLGIRYLIVDSEWRAYETEDMGQFIASRCDKRADIGTTSVYEVRWP